jgi:RNA polymerase sigma factor (sigma-70 family)
MGVRRSSVVRLPPFQTLLDDNADAVLRYLRAAVGANDAEDCFQETFLSALRAYPNLRDASNLSGWLMTIAHRKALDAHRARGRRPLPVEQVADVAVVDDDRGDPALWRAVRRLPSKQRSAVFLRFAADLDYAQIGLAIGCSDAAARQNVRAGLATIRQGWTP